MGAGGLSPLAPPLTLTTADIRRASSLNVPYPRGGGITYSYAYNGEPKIYLSANLVTIIPRYGDGLEKSVCGGRS